MIDPTRKEILKDYGLDEYKNSLWENFIGSSVSISYIEKADGTKVVTRENFD